MVSKSPPNISTYLCSDRVHSWFSHPWGSLVSASQPSCPCEWCLWFNTQLCQMQPSVLSCWCPKPPVEGSAVIWTPPSPNLSPVGSPGSWSRTQVFKDRVSSPSYPIVSSSPPSPHFRPRWLYSPFPTPTIAYAPSPTSGWGWLKTSPSNCSVFSSSTLVLIFPLAPPGGGLCTPPTLSHPVRIIDSSRWILG